MKFNLLPTGTPLGNDCKGGQSKIDNMKEKKIPPQYEIKYGLYQNFQTLDQAITQKELIEKIKTDSTIQAQQKTLRELKAQIGITPEYDKLKRTLLAYTPSGCFPNERKNNAEVKYSNEIVIDVDKLKKQGINKSDLINKLKKDAFVKMMCTSVSGDGLAITIKIDSEAKDHKEAFLQTSYYFEQKYNIICDPACKDVSRLRFIPHDPDVYFNQDSKTFHVFDSDWNLQMLELLDFTSNSSQYEEGNRNNYVHLFMCNANRRGYPAEEVLQWALIFFHGLNDKEIENSCESGYSNSDEHGKYEGVAAPIAAIASIAAVPKVSFKNAVAFSDDIFEHLPLIFTFIPNLTDDKRERDVLFFACLALLSSIFPDVHGIYSGSEIYANLYCALYAPSGAGKGKLKHIRAIGDGIHDYLVNSCLKSISEYNKEKSRCEKEECNDTPIEPKCKGLYIKGDISSSALKDLLDKGGYHFILEMESYVLSKNKGKDWGDAEDVFLNSWEHEPIGKSRVGDIIEQEVKCPKLSMCVSGTPDMLKKLLDGVESGSFSRNCFYVFDTEVEWKDQFSDHSSKAPTYVAKAKKDLLKIFKYIRKHPFEFRLTKKQQKQHTEIYQQHTADFKASGLPRSFYSSIARNGKVFFKLAMIFTALRRYENKGKDAIEYCTDEDFNTVKSITTTMLNHAKMVFTFLGGDADKPEAKDYKEYFFESLPNKFTRSEAVAMGKKQSYAERTVDSWLKEWTGTHIKCKKRGQYVKIETVAKPANAAVSAVIDNQHTN